MSIFEDIRHIARGMTRSTKSVFASRPSRVTRDKMFRAFAQMAYERGADAKRAQMSYYPGAAVGRAHADWLTQICTSTSLLRGSYKLLAARSEYAYRTDPYARRAIEILKAFIVGSGAIPYPSIISDANGEPEEDLNKILADHWERFNEEGIRNGSQNMTVYEAQGLEIKTIMTLGGNLCNRVRSKPGSWLPIAFQFIKPYRLDFWKDTYIDDYYYRSLLAAKGTPLIVLGQIMNELAEPSAFYLLGEGNPIPASQLSLHYLQMEAEQYLGIPWLTPALGNIWDQQQLFEDKMTQSRLLTRMGVYINKKAKKDFDAILETDETGEESIPFDKASCYFGDEKPEPIQFDDKISEGFGPLVRMNLHAVAVGAGFSYQLLSSDLEGANFSGSRTNTIIDTKSFQSLFKMFINTGSTTKRIWDNFVEYEILSGKIPGISYSQFLADPKHYTRCYWLPEGMGWVDPLKDAQAQILLYRTGQLTLQGLCAANGTNYKQVIAQRKREKTELKAADLAELLPTFDAKKGTDPVQEDPENEQKPSSKGVNNA